MIAVMKRFHNHDKCWGDIVTEAQVENIMVSCKQLHMLLPTVYVQVPEYTFRAQQAKVFSNWCWES